MMKVRYHSFKEKKKDRDKKKTVSFTPKLFQLAYLHLALNLYFCLLLGKSLGHSLRQRLQSQCGRLVTSLIPKPSFEKCLKKNEAMVLFLCICYNSMTATFTKKNKQNCTSIN